MRFMLREPYLETPCVTSPIPCFGNTRATVWKCDDPVKSAAAGGGKYLPVAAAAGVRREVLYVP